MYRIVILTTTPRMIYSEEVETTKEYEANKGDIKSIELLIQQ